jgi:hypothetical protein
VFGSLIRSRRNALNMRQDDLSLATGVGRRAFQSDPPRSIGETGTTPINMNGADKSLLKVYG